MSKKLDKYSIYIIRDEIILEIADLISQEKRKEIFVALTNIEVLLAFLAKRMQKVKPKIGFADKLLYSIFNSGSLHTFSGLQFAEFASDTCKEDILKRCLFKGWGSAYISISGVLSILKMLKREITEQEIFALANKSCDSEESYSQVISLAQMYHPELLSELRKKKDNYDNAPSY